jgi:cold shock CspA family protein
MLTGIVKFWNQKQTYGFITTDVEKVTYFVHLSDVVGLVELRPSMKVQFARGTDTRTGKVVARDVEVIRNTDAEKCAVQQ